MNTPGRAFLLDPALIHPIGHHLNVHRTLAEALRQRNVTAIHMVNRFCDDDMVRGLHVAKFFRLSPYIRTSDDPVVGPLENFETHADHFEHDMAALKPGVITADDLVILPIVSPGPLMGYVRWWASLDPAARPHTVIMFQMLGGMLSVDPPVYDTSSPAYDLLPHCYRLIGNKLAGLDCARLHFMAAAETMTPQFAHLLKQPVGLHPFYRVFDAADIDPVAEAFERSGAPPTLGFFGDQRIDKGFDVLPDVLEILLARHPTAEFVVQTSGIQTDSELANSFIGDAVRRIHGLAARTPRLRLIQGFVSLNDFCGALAQADIVLQPYQPFPYTLLPSGLFNDATAIGRASVVPSGTWMAGEIPRLDGLGAVHHGYDPATIADAALGLLNRSAELRARAPDLRRMWRSRHGTDLLVDRMLARIQTPAGATAAS